MHSLFRGYAKSGGDASIVIRIVIVRIAVIIDHTKIIAIPVVGRGGGSFIAWPDIEFKSKDLSKSQPALLRCRTG